MYAFRIAETITVDNILAWAIALVSLFTSIYAIVKATRMGKREVRGADLDNESKEVSIANQYDELATKAAEKAVKLQERLDTLEEDYHKLQTESKEHKDTIARLETQIASQGETIRLQATQIEVQEGQIETLKCELSNSQTYISALIQQMKEANIIPVDRADVIKDDCTTVKNKRTRKPIIKESEI